MVTGKEPFWRTRCIRPCRKNCTIISEQSKEWRCKWKSVCSNGCVIKCHEHWTGTKPDERLWEGTFRQPKFPGGCHLIWAWLRSCWSSSMLNERAIGICILKHLLQWYHGWQFMIIQIMQNGVLFTLQKWKTLKTLHLRCMQSSWMGILLLRGQRDVSTKYQLIKLQSG